MRKTLSLLAGIAAGCTMMTAQADYDLSDGSTVYNQACAACHAAGVAGAPKSGDAQAWEDRLDKGMATLIEHSIEGFRGDAGFMPPRGGRSGLSDEEVSNAVAYMINEVADLEDVPE